MIGRQVKERITGEPLEEQMEREIVFQGAIRKMIEMLDQ